MNIRKLRRMGYVIVKDHQIDELLKRSMSLEPEEKRIFLEKMRKARKDCKVPSNVYICPKNFLN